MSSILTVGEIQDPTNGNTAVSIDSSGRVLTPAKPAFYATRSANWENISTGSDHLIPFNTENFDVGSNYNTSTYEFTAPLTAIYSFSWHVRLQSIDTASSYFQLYIADGSGTNLDAYTYDNDSTWKSDVDYFSFTGSTLQQVTAGQKRRLEIFIPNGHAATDVHSESYFCGFLVG